MWFWNEGCYLLWIAQNNAFLLISTGFQISLPQITEFYALDFQYVIVIRAHSTFVCLLISIGILKNEILLLLCIDLETKIASHKINRSGVNASYLDH